MIAATLPCHVVVQHDESGDSGCDDGLDTLVICDDDDDDETTTTTTTDVSV